MDANKNLAQDPRLERLPGLEAHEKSNFYWGCFIVNELNNGRSRSLRLTTASFSTLILASLIVIGCSKSAAPDSSSENANANKKLTIMPELESGTAVAVSGSVVITPNGGLAPYSFSVISGHGGYFVKTLGLFSTFVAPSTPGQVNIEVFDSSNPPIVTTFSFSVAGNQTGWGSLVVYPLVADTSGSGILSVSGGNPPYTYSLIQANTGSFDDSTYSGASTQGIVKVQINDINGDFTQTSIFVSGPITCPPSGFYTNSTGGVYSCVSGTPIYTPPTGYPYSPNPTTNCDSWVAVYGQPYVPIYISGVLFCTRYSDFISLILPNSNYAATGYGMFGPDYYTMYPPYTSKTCSVGTAITVTGYPDQVCF